MSEQITAKAASTGGGAVALLFVVRESSQAVAASAMADAIAARGLVTCGEEVQRATTAAAVRVVA